jgi:hypothetical protein
MRLQLNGLTFSVDIEHDDSMGAPWKEHDGHGIVSEWTQRDKRPGERILCSDRTSHRYYDFAETVKIAKRDGWGPGKPHEAAEADFKHLKAWCDDEWHWVGIVVSLLDVDGNKVPGYSDSLWGIEGDGGDYIESEAREIASALAARVGDSDKVCLTVRQDAI